MTTKMHCVVLDRTLDQEKKAIKDIIGTMGKSDGGILDGGILSLLNILNVIIIS